MNTAESEFFREYGISYMETIGKGCFGIIFQVYSSKYKTNFALKRIPSKLYNESETECLNRIDHPRIVRLYNIFKFNSNIYLLMELCPTDLMKLAKHKISDSNLIKYVFEMIGCIKVCHDFNIAHNDIKPSNFLLDQYGHVKICDFGLSKIYTENPMSFDKKGSKYYMAPEMFTNGMYNPIVTDIWALGVTIYYLSTSTYPFDAETEEQLVEKINNCKYSTEKIKDDRLRDLIARCLVVNPNERANVNELLNMPYFSAPRANTWLEPGGLYKNRKICKTHDCILKPKIENNSPLYRRMFPHSHQARVRYTSNNF